MNATTFSETETYDSCGTWTVWKKSRSVLLRASRSQFVSSILLLVVVACLPVTQVAQAAARESAVRPNIVFIMADDLGWADVAFHGGVTATKHLDQLVQDGLELTAHYVAPVCSPTRSGLMTGRCWSRFGITTPVNELALPMDTVTLPRALVEAGYDTCLVGKWHLGSLPKWGPNHFGFQHAYGSLAGGVSPWNHRYKKGPFTVTWHRNQELIEESGHVTDLLTREAVSWIASREDRPFFLYVPYTAVHLPVKEPQVWLDQVPDSVTDLVARHYAASILHLDDGVGKILQALQNKGVRRNTLVVFTSDNGGSTAENNDLKYPDDQCPNGRLPGNNLPLRGRKGNVYEGGIKVPTVVSWPAQIAAGRFDSPVQIIDWMPTFCALAGYESAQDLKWDGIDLSEALRHHQPIADRWLYTAGPSFRQRAVRHGDWKLVVFGKGDSERHELFDLQSDPGETQNLATTRPEKLQHMLKGLEAVAARDRDAVAERKK